MIKLPIPLTSFPAYATTPFSAALTNVPLVAAIFIPSLNKPLFFAPYADKILPRTGHENLELERAATFGNCFLGFEDIFCCCVFLATTVFCVVSFLLTAFLTVTVACFFPVVLFSTVATLVSFTVGVLISLTTA